MTIRFSPKGILTHGTMILLSLTAVVPICWMVVTSLRPATGIFEATLWPSEVTFDNYVYVFDAIPMLRMLWNTFVMASATAIAQVLTGLTAAYALTRWRFRGGKAVQALIALSWLVPFQVTMIPNYVLSTKLGLLNTITGLVLPNAAAAFAVLLLVNAMRSFPRQVIEAARMDDAGHWRILWQIIVPNLRAPLASLGVLAFISAWNEYFWPLLLIRRMDDAVVQIGLQMFMSQEGNQWGPLMAAATLASLPVLAIYLVLHRQIIESFMKSGIK
ncbi:carbohydrate ABC transporter permease [Sulfitobacter geojensis]|uniref:carbohydrate ABC transporter permease n=1 Tax=Sulfitobacter geojensis TaxID=1342299 RepID=UPI000468953C|nr:carbohydrate ABC transporter permease [Sulfitobacter geojensis]NYI30244.1 ABC-type glycerol-3-phosphate transport system permease component [Sulfitobacter geojensis]